jgi:hypothetical protein
VVSDIIQKQDAGAGSSKEYGTFRFSRNARSRVRMRHLVFLNLPAPGGVFFCSFGSAGITGWDAVPASAGQLIPLVKFRSGRARRKRQPVQCVE